MGEQLTLPDACVGPEKNDGVVALAANKRARQLLNKGFEGKSPRWSEIERAPGNILNSPGYRVLELETCPGLFAMMCNLHQAGCAVMYWCEAHDGYHFMDDEAEKAFRHAAICGAEGVTPEHKTPQ